MPGGAREQQQRHDPRLRQRHVVAPRPGRRRARRGSTGRAATSGGRERERGERRRGAPAAVTSGGERRTGRARRSDGASSRRCAIQRGDDERDERRQRERARSECAAPDAERARDDRERAVAAAARERGQAQPGSRAGLELTALLQPCAAGRRAAARSSRTGRCRSCAPAAARSCTTRACRRATGRCPRAARCATSIAFQTKTRMPTPHHVGADRRDQVVLLQQARVLVGVDPARHPEQARACAAGRTSR